MIFLINNVFIFCALSAVVTTMEVLVGCIGFFFILRLNRFTNAMVNAICSESRLFRQNQPNWKCLNYEIFHQRVKLLSKIFFFSKWFNRTVSWSSSSNAYQMNGIHTVRPSSNQQFTSRMLKLETLDPFCCDSRVDRQI